MASAVGIQREFPKISDKVLNVVLLQIKPGKEDQFCKKLSEKGINFLSGFGRYDLVVYAERRDFSLISDLRAMTFDSILDFDVISGFKWINNEGESKSKVGSDKTIIGLCCIKLDIRKSSETSLLDSEQEALSKISSANYTDDTAVSVYGGLGWHELLVLIETKSIESLCDAVHTIKQCVPLISEIITIPAINLLKVKDGSSPQPDGDVEAKIFLDLTGFRLSLRDFCKTEFGDPGTSAFGFHDYEIAYTGKIVHLVEALQKMRELYSDIIGGTFTILEHPPEKFEWKSFSHSNTSTNIDKIKQRIASYPQKLRDNLSDLTFFLNLFEAAANDHRTDDVFMNLDLLFKNLLDLYEDAYTRLSYEDLEGYDYCLEEFNYAVDCLRMAYLQRYSGIQLGNLLSWKSLNIGSDGLSLRVIRAAETIPFYLLQKASLSFTGFCFFSFHGTFFRNPLGIIGFPSSSLRNTDEFWGIFHESGHEAYVQLLEANTFAQIQTKREQLVATIRSNYVAEGFNEKIVEEMPLESEYDALIEEIFSDAVDFHLGFWDNWKLYLRTVWPYVAKYFPLNEKYVIRMLVLFSNLGPRKIHSNIEFKDIILDGVNQLQAAADIQIPEETVVNAGNILEYLRAFDIDKEIIKIVCSLPIKTLNDDELLKIRASFDKGIPLRNLTPVAIVRALLVKPIDEKNYVARFSALMSLFDIYGNILAANLKSKKA